MKIILSKLKVELKLLAQEIRTLKSKRKGSPNGYVSGLEEARNTYRVKHIARCMLRGRTLEQIEPKLRNPDCYSHVRIRKQAMEIVAKAVQEQTKVEVLSES
jgi:hypothetical protein